MIVDAVAVRFQLLRDVIDLSYLLSFSGFGELVATLVAASLRFQPNRLARLVVFGNLLGAALGSCALGSSDGSTLMRMRWLPLDPPWLIVPVIAGVLLGAGVLSNDGSFLLMWAAMGVAIVCGTFGLDRWYERRHPGGRLR